MCGMKWRQSETETDKSWMVSCICGIYKKTELIEIESRLVVPVGRDRRSWRNG